MKTRTMILAIVALAASVTAYFAAEAVANRGDGALGTVYVTSQGLYYDTFVSAETLPPRGPFQPLADGMTEYGPGDPGYLGGRWWIDSNDNGVPDSDDTYLLCPLLPPGRPMP